MTITKEGIKNDQKHHNLISNVPSLKPDPEKGVNFDELPLDSL